MLLSRTVATLNLVFVGFWSTVGCGSPASLDKQGIGQSDCTPADVKSAMTLFDSDRSEFVIRAGEKKLFAALAQGLVGRAEVVIGQLVQSPTEQALEAFDKALTDLGDAQAMAGAIRMIFSDSAINAGATTLDINIDAYRSNLFANRQIYEKLPQVDTPREDLNSFRRKILKELGRRGADLEQAKINEIETITRDLTRLENDFEKTATSNSLWVDFSVGELQNSGLSADWISGHTQGGKVSVDMGVRADYEELLFYSNSREVRRKAWTMRQRLGFVNSSGEPLGNIQRLENIIQRRNELAKIYQKAPGQSYASWNEFEFEPLMLKSPQEADRFMQTANGLTMEAAQNELAALKGVSQDIDIKPWDSNYLVNQYKKSLRFDPERVSRYFQVDRVKEGLFRVLADMLDVQISRVRRATWGNGVEVYEVRDPSGRLLSTLYTDLYRRENKDNSSASVTPLQTSRNGGPSVIVMVTGYPEGGYLNPRSYETLAHEFGHVMHAIASRARVGMLSYGDTEREYSEVPSTFLEMLSTEPEFIAAVLQPTPNEQTELAPLIQQYANLSRFGRAFEFRRQMKFSEVAKRMHEAQRHPEDLFGEIDSKWQPSHLQTYTNPDDSTEDAHRLCSFLHLAWTGYGATYLQYQVAEVIAADILKTYLSAGPLSRNANRLYTRALLEPGASQDAAYMLSTYFDRAYELTQSFSAFREMRLID